MIVRKIVGLLILATLFLGPVVYSIVDEVKENGWKELLRKSQIGIAIVLAFCAVIMLFLLGLGLIVWGEV